VNDNRLAYGVGDREAVGEEGGDGDAVTAEEGRKVACVVGMRATVGIEMRARVFEGIGGVARASTPIVDMKAEDGGGAYVLGGGESVDLGKYDGTAVGVKQLYRASHGGVRGAALHYGCGGRQKGEHMGESQFGMLLFHGIPRFLFSICMTPGVRAEKGFLGEFC